MPSLEELLSDSSVTQGTLRKLSCWLPINTPSRLSSGRRGRIRRHENDSQGPPCREKPWLVILRSGAWTIVVETTPGVARAWMWAVQCRWEQGAEDKVPGMHEPGPKKVSGML